MMRTLLPLRHFSLAQRVHTCPQRLTREIFSAVLRRRHRRAMMDFGVIPPALTRKFSLSRRQPILTRSSIWRRMFQRCKKSRWLFPAMKTRQGRSGIVSAIRGEDQDAGRGVHGAAIARKAWGCRIARALAPIRCDWWRLLNIVHPTRGREEDSSV